MLKTCNSFPMELNTLANVLLPYQLLLALIVSVSATTVSLVAILIMLLWAALQPADVLTFSAAFMPMRKALTLLSGALALREGLKGGEVYVLDMGAPVRIVDLAEQLIRLKGLEPAKDIEIKFTGLRAGEKLHEEIFYSAEAVRDSGVSGVMIAAAEGRLKAELDSMICACAAAAHARSTGEALEILNTIVKDHCDAAAERLHAGF